MWLCLICLRVDPTGLSDSLMKHDRGKRCDQAALSLCPQGKCKRNTKRKNRARKTEPANYLQLAFLFLLISLVFPFKLPVWAACCCTVSLWGSWAAPWSSRWPFAVLWLRAQHLSWHFAVCQRDAAGTLCAAAGKRRSSAGSSLASSFFSTSSSLPLSLGPRAHAVHRLTGGSTRKHLSVDKWTEQIPKWKLVLGVNRCMWKSLWGKTGIYLTIWMIYL